MDPRHERELEKGLSAIYRDEAGDMPDLSTFEPLKNRWWLYALITAVVFTVILLSAAWAGFAIFKPFRGISGQGFEIKIEGPEEIALGQEVTYFINYRNRTTRPVASADLRVSFPTDFMISQIEPESTDQLVWKLGSLPVDERGTIKVRGTFTGAIGTVTAVQVVGTYRPISAQSDFEALATKVLNYKDSVLEGVLVVPLKVLPGDKVHFDYKVLNGGLSSLESLQARLYLPEGFQLDNATSGQVSGRVIKLPIGTLAAGASTTISVVGTFASGVSGEAHLIAEAGRSASDGAFFTAQKTETSFTVLAGDLSLKLVMNGRDADSVIAYGSPLRFAINYENTAPEELKDVQLTLKLETVTTTELGKITGLVDWKTLHDSASGTRKGDSVAWSKVEIAALGRLPAHEDGLIDLSVNAIKAATGTSGLEFRAYVEAAVAMVGTTKVNRVVRSAPINIKFLSDADALAEARYYSEEGAPLGFGPLPPVVGQVTTYRVHWTVAKTVHELKDLKLKATLPKIAAWPDKTNLEAGEIVFDPNTRIVTWTLNRLPLTQNEINAEFDVRITPGESDANRFAQLLGETTFEALDANVNEKISRTLPALTTDLQNDENAQSKGVVRQAD